VDVALQVELLAAAGVALGMAMLIGHEVWTRVLAVLGTILFGVVLVVLVVAT
jgi:hypothetical protein